MQLLPSLDGYIMGFCNRCRFLDPEHYDQVFDRSGNAFATVWVDGRVVGIWREIEYGLELLVWDELAREEVGAEAARLGTFLWQADGRQTEHAGEVVVRPYPAELYVKTPFNLGQR